MPGDAPAPRRPASTRVALLFTRVGLPMLLTAGGVVLMVMGHGHYTSVLANRDSLLSALGMGLVLIAVTVILLDWMIRLTMSSDRDREREQRARDYFTRTGHWPGEGGGRRGPS